MQIAPEILEHFKNLSFAQKQVVGHIGGPLLVIAGPGSGKTYSIVLRALNLLLLGEVSPKQLVLCTFTEKAAFEMRDRLSTFAREASYSGDLSELRISTIHGLCNRILLQHRHKTKLGHGFETLDDLTQLLFIYDRFDDIVGPPAGEQYLYQWKTQWSAVAGIRSYFDKITEELVDFSALRQSEDPFVSALGSAYQAYEAALIESNRTDFAHLQRYVYDLLSDPELKGQVAGDVEHLLVDEYQDTNYIQEQLLLKLSALKGNLCVVGDEDQSLYRFRGATVRNILEFPKRMPGCKVVKLLENYRSHKDIIEQYDQWMASADWRNPQGSSFRYDKTIQASENSESFDYPAAIKIHGDRPGDEAGHFVDMVQFFKDEGVIEDYSQVALLLHSVREKHSGPYIEALKAKGIPVYCPRARTYFDLPDVRDMIACFALILGWYGKGRGTASRETAKLAAYVDKSLVALSRRYSAPHPLILAVREWTREIALLKKGESLDLRLADYLYRLLAFEPFKHSIHNESSARNIAIFSRLLSVFENYYHYTIISHKNREILRVHFFASFLKLIFDGGINEYEDPDQPFPRGHIQIMTIHQAKGLEFPIVAVGSLDNKISSQKQIDRKLGPFYSRIQFEPEDRITHFDRMRLHYVAFSRPQKVLILTSHNQPRSYFSPIWEGLPQWPNVEKGLFSGQHFDADERSPAKKSYSFTGDVRTYDTCPRQYQFFRKYSFAPSRSADIFFGLLVHQTIEELHRLAMEGLLGTINPKALSDLFEQTFRFLCLSNTRQIGEASKKAAFKQIMDYYHQNLGDMTRILQTEVDVSLEKENYFLVGKVDLLLGGDGKLEVLDFKTSQRPKHRPDIISAYEGQLCTYAHILEKRYGKPVDRLLLYWTGEEKKGDALMALEYDPSRIDEAGKYFDEIVERIQKSDFRISRSPGMKICNECDLKNVCTKEGVLS